MLLKSPPGVCSPSECIIHQVSKWQTIQTMLWLVLTHITQQSTAGYIWWFHGDAISHEKRVHPWSLFHQIKSAWLYNLNKNGLPWKCFTSCFQSKSNGFIGINLGKVSVQVCGFLKECITSYLKTEPFSHICIVTHDLHYLIWWYTGSDKHAHIEPAVTSIETSTLPGACPLLVIA